MNGAAGTLAQALDLDVVIFFACAISFRPRRSATSMTPRQDEGKADLRSDELRGARRVGGAGKLDGSRTRRYPLNVGSGPLGAFVLLDPRPHDLVVPEPLVV